MSQVQLTSMAKSSLVFALFVSIYASNFVQGQNTVKLRLNETSNLTCYVEGHNLQHFNWTKTIGANNTQRLKHFSNVTLKNDTYAGITIGFANVTREDNGTYACWAQTADGSTVRNTSDLIILEKPEIKEFVAKAVMVGKIYLSWKLYDGNDPIANYSFSYRENSTNGQLLPLDQLKKGKHSNYVVDSQDKLKNGSVYLIGIEANNTIGSSKLYYSHSVTPLEKDFVPKPVLKEATNDSIVITWMKPEGDLQDYYNYTAVFNKKGELANTTNIAGNNTLTIKSLQPKTNYQFKVKACIINYPDTCAAWSEEMEGQTRASNNGISSTSVGPHTLLINTLSLIGLSLYFLIN